ncbi:agamous-like MADS-box protein AGL16 [Magnolia sinica]|uniref:agamous-like MADS-box protein AGL16 n=1 Tax=Magnolia sinica TaxID=86752 RepID=UPI00265818A3|nr:agamous-like MADS-box protein AGL16 [Magnolia sinica]
MGRARIPIKLIDDSKARNTTFKKRSRGLLKKMFEFATLCSVDACMICFGPDGDRLYAHETWPKDPLEVEHMIKRYRSLSIGERDKRKVDLSRYLSERKKKLEHELNQWNEEKSRVEYPTWDFQLNEWSEAALRELAVTLDSKIEIVKRRIRFFKDKEKLQGREIVISPQVNSDHMQSALGMYINALDDVQLAPFPPCFDPLDSLQIEEKFPYGSTSMDASAMLPISNYSDFNDTYVHISQCQPSYNSRFHALEADVNGHTIFQNDFNVGYLHHEAHHFQPLIHGSSSCMNPQPTNAVFMSHQMPHRLLPQANHPYYGPLEVQEVKIDPNREMEVGFMQRGSSETFPSKVCHLCQKCLESKDIFMYRGLTFCSVECRKHQIDTDEVTFKAESLRRKGNFGKESLKLPIRGVFLDDF